MVSLILVYGGVPLVSSRFLPGYAHGLGNGKGDTVAKVVEHLAAHYEVRDVEIGKVYRWRPESVVVECECGMEQTLTASKYACDECGTDHRTLVEDVLEPRADEEEEEVLDHPWRSLRPYYEPTRGT